MCVALGGRASEEINFKKVSTGALNDLERVTKQAYAMVTYFGMSKKIGNISFYDSSGQNEYNFSKPYSETTAETIDNEVKEIVDKAFKRAKDLLTKNKEGLTRLAELLLEKEVIFSEDLERIFGKRKFKKPESELLIKQQNDKQDNSLQQENTSESDSSDSKINKLNEKDTATSDVGENESPAKVKDKKITPNDNSEDGLPGKERA